ncbi:hypothetical protein [Novipirellula rosea]|uniref:Uncharacterized protein n=1 Tax=Novipirellula rosea TaxID=1031540 RepID=A0ABP8MV28_9BACT
MSSVSTDYLADRRELLRQQADDVQAAERLATIAAEQDHRRQRLLAVGYSADDADAIEAIRKEVEFAVLTAMAQCRRVWIDRGVLRVEESREAKFEERLSPFNVRYTGHRCTVAAVVFVRLSGGHNGR